MRKKNHPLFVSLASIANLLLMGFNNPVFAQSTQNRISNPLNGVDSLEQLIVNLINWILILIGFVAVLYLIWSGFKYVTAGGDSKKAGEAKEGITHAIIGIAIAMVAVLLVQFLYTSILDVDSNITSNVFGESTGNSSGGPSGGTQACPPLNPGQFSSCTTDPTKTLDCVNGAWVCR